MKTENRYADDRLKSIAKYREVVPLVLEPPDKDLLSTKGARVMKSSTLSPFTGTWTKREARHLLSRTMFGVTKSDLTDLLSMTMEEAVDSIVQPSPIPAPPVNDYEGLGDASDPYVGLGESWIDSPHGSSKEGLRIVSLKNWLIKNMLHQPSTIHSRMVLFWSNILVSKIWGVFAGKASYQYFRKVYENALGNYKTFIREITLDPSMLIFLNGARNTKDAPDENYARELQELFCVGKGPDSNYTEEDVQAAAKVLTGWRINKKEARETNVQYASFFNENLHDTSDKQFSEFYNNRLITGKSGEDGALELDELIDMIFDNEETAKYICRRIYSFFVYNEITADVEENIIVPLAEIFRQNQYDILPVLKALFKSDHFYSEQNIGALIKSPADHLIGFWRTFGVVSPDDGDLVKDYQKHRAMLWHMSGMGMEIGDPPNVAGWMPYYQMPQYDKAWITTTTITKRAKTTDSTLSWGFWVSSSRRIYGDVLGFVSTLEHPEDPNLLLQEAVFLFLGIEVSDDVLSELKTILLSGVSEHYWTTAWNAYVEDPQNESKKSVVETRLKSAFKHLLQRGEYHLM